LHFWEEPIISGTRGSGTVFFSGCSLRCIYCQNREISRAEYGEQISVERLSAIFGELEQKGAHNINLVTPTHFVPSIASAIDLARANGLTVPVVYNTASYETDEALDLLSGRVNVFLPDLKYYKSETALRYSSANDLPTVSKHAIERMVNMTGAPVLNSEGIIARGTVVRILLLPSHVAEAKLNLRYLYEKYGNSIYISLMSQYTPPRDMPSPLDRRVTHAEYRELVSYAERLGVVNAFTQEREAAEESFIPPFDNTGVLSR
jgi:putative pyruvate formate lyase activating enzyme